MKGKKKGQNANLVKVISIQRERKKKPEGSGFWKDSHNVDLLAKKRYMWNRLLNCRYLIFTLQLGTKKSNQTRIEEDL